MFNRGAWLLSKKWFVNLGQENLVRVKNYPLQYRVLTRRPLPDQKRWDAKLEGIVRKRLSSKGKSESLPYWYRQGEIPDNKTKILLHEN